jgi:hypothetical protein
LASDDASNLTADVSAEHEWYDRPLVINRAKVPLVVYLERGILFNKQVIRPGEAVQLYSAKHGPSGPFPYSLIALVGDERALPSEMDSLINFAGMVAVPTVFTAAVALTILTGGSIAGTFGVANGVTGATVAGQTVTTSAVKAVIDFFGATSLGTLGGVTITPELAIASLAVGTQAGAVANGVAKRLVANHPKMFMRKKRHIFPGTKYFEITGGPSSNGEEVGHEKLSITEISAGTFMSYNISTKKHCVEEESRQIMEKIEFVINDCGDKRAIGKWTSKIGDRNSGRPRYRKVDDDKWIIEWSKTRKAWRMLYDNTFFGHGRDSLYESKENYGSAPDEGWEICDKCTGGLPIPDIDLMVSSEVPNIDEMVSSSQLPSIGDVKKQLAVARGEPVIVIGESDSEEVQSFTPDGS